MRDRYDLHEELGRGAMGVVFRATDRQLGRDVALKLIAKSIADDDEAVARFRREVAAAAALSHPNIVRVFECGTCDDGIYFTMELVDATPLDERIGEGALGSARVAQLLLQLADALSALHARGMVHRDVKSANVMVGADDHATLMDFGLVHLPDRSVLTAPGQLVGTPLYMAPEIWRGDGFGPASDVYSLGVRALAQPRPGAHAVFPFVPQLPVGRRAEAGEVLTATVAGMFFTPAGIPDDDFAIALRQHGEDGVLAARQPKGWVVESGGELILSNSNGGRSDPFALVNLTALGGVALVTISR